MMKHVVVFTGAGISAESGLKTFRDSDGLWEGYNVQDVATPRAWAKDPELVLRFYNERRQNIIDAKPNAAHLAIAALETEYQVTVITQNIDDLHERAGSSHILHLHGEIFKMRSEFDEHHVVDIRGDIALGDKAPDGGQYRPHIVWFEEAVPEMSNAIRYAMDADIFVVIGTSLVVYPAASILHYLPPFMPVIVIDRKLPSLQRHNLHTIELPATEGVQKLHKLLQELL